MSEKLIKVQSEYNEMPVRINYDNKTAALNHTGIEWCFLTFDEIDAIHAEIHKDETRPAPAAQEVEQLLDSLLHDLSNPDIPDKARFGMIQTISIIRDRLAVLPAEPVPVGELKAGRYRMMIPVEISTTGGLLLDRRDGLHGYSLEDYPNARFFKGW